MEYVTRIFSFLFGVAVFLLMVWNSHNHLYGIQPNIGPWGFIGIPIASLAMAAAIHKK